MSIGLIAVGGLAIGTNPAFMQKFYSAAAAGKWDQAIKLQHHVVRFFGELDALLAKYGEADSDPAVDKAMAVASGFHKAHQRCRPPYFGWGDASIVALKQLMQANYPELIYSE